MEQQLQGMLRNLEVFLKFYQKMAQEQDLYLSRSFNVFNMFKIHENVISNILADFLNPKGSHGQQKTFLSEFVNLLRTKIHREELKFMDIDGFGTGDFGIEREKVNDQGRVDIIMKFHPEGFKPFCIVIENKPWAAEQQEQMARYWNYLKNNYQDQFLLIYLSKEGDNPTSIDPADWQRLQGNGQGLNLSYKEDMKSWLEKCYEKCKSEKMRLFLKDFINYFGAKGVNMAEEENELILKYAMEPTNIEKALKIGSIFEELPKKIFEGFKQDLKRELEMELGQEWKFSVDGEFFIHKHSWIDVRNEAKYKLGIHYHEANRFCLGVSKLPQPQMPDLENLRNELNQKLRIGDKCDWWVWWYWDDNYQPKGINTLIAMVQNRPQVITYFKEKILKIKEIATPFIDEALKSQDVNQ